MVVTQLEGERIITVMKRWFKEEDLVRAVEEIWKEIAQYSDNESFRETIKLIKGGIKNND